MMIRVTSSWKYLVADLSLTETVDIAGSNAVFTITVRNSGPDDATGIVIKNSKLASAANYTYVSHGNTAGTYITSPQVTGRSLHYWMVQAQH